LFRIFEVIIPISIFGAQLTYVPYTSESYYSQMLNALMFVTRVFRQEWIKHAY